MTAEVSSAMQIENVYEKDKEEVETKTSTKPSSDSPVLYSPELLQMYYSRLFPFSMMYEWLSYGNTDPTVFSRREFSFTIEPVPGEEIYIRYQSFSSQNELASAILKRRPAKIDIGAVFSHAPKDHNTIASGKFKPVQRELVFDIDLTDYDDVRACGCSGAKICPVCWGFMNMAVHTLDRGLREDFGFEHVAWFYSGRRGIHAWVCDPAARDLTDGARSAVARYLEVELGTEKNKEIGLTLPLHPMLERSLRILEPMFVEQVLPSSGHGLLATPEACKALLETLPSIADRVKENVKKDFKHQPTLTPAERWETIKDHLAAFLKKAGKTKTQKTMGDKESEKLEMWTYATILKYTYPRLDINVSKMRNHLLKSPFCVHPKTGRVCVPIHDIDSFDPFAVPTLPSLMKELDEFEETDATKNLPAWKKTSLKDYFDPFATNFLEPLCQAIRKQQKDEADEKAALVGDF